MRRIIEALSTLGQVAYLSLLLARTLPGILIIWMIIKAVR